MTFSTSMAPCHQFSIEDCIQGTNLTNKDRKRLTGGYMRVFNVMKDANYRNPDQIAVESNVRLDSALRHIRMMQERGHTKEMKHLGNGLYLYRIIPSFDEV